jgi:hypothetical protein
MKTTYKPFSILNKALDWSIVLFFIPIQGMKNSTESPSSRPDIFVYTEKKKRVLLIELTVPWKTNIPKDHAI